MQPAFVGVGALHVDDLCGRLLVAPDHHAVAERDRVLEGLALVEAAVDGSHGVHGGLDRGALLLALLELP